jgi:hypothetical protein
MLRCLYSFPGFTLPQELWCLVIYILGEDTTKLDLRTTLDVVGGRDGSGLDVPSAGTEWDMEWGHVGAPVGCPSGFAVGVITVLNPGSGVKMGFLELVVGVLSAPVGTLLASGYDVLGP